MLMLLHLLLFSNTVFGIELERSPYGGRVGKTYDITSFGAKPDNSTLNTVAFEKGTYYFQFKCIFFYYVYSSL